MQKIKIITTVGTSVFENYLKDRSVSESKSDFKKDYEILKEEANPYSKYGSLKDVLDELGEIISSWYTNNSNASAEIKSILKIKEQTEGEVEVHLIATDTILSVKAAELIKEWLITNKIIVNEKIEIIEGLRVNDSNEFIEKGIQNLIKEVLEIHELNNQENSILNISGGFKAMIPVLTIVGQLYDIPLFYIYEDSDTSIELQRLPINFDWDVIQAYTNFLTDPEHLKGDDVGTAPEEMMSLQLIKKVGEDFQLTVIGRLLSEFLKRRPPHFDTVFGYLVEYKIKECLESEFGSNNIRHGYKSATRSFDGDLDLIVFNEKGMETIEVKPDALLDDKERLTHFMTKLIDRTKIAQQELEKAPTQLSLMVYRFKQPNDPPTYKLSQQQFNSTKCIEKQIKATFPSAEFQVKCFYVKPNKIKRGERILHQKFIRDSLKFNQIQTIFPTK